MLGGVLGKKNAYYTLQQIQYIAKLGESSNAIAWLGKCAKGKTVPQKIKESLLIVGKDDQSLLFKRKGVEKFR